jgi:hypothetical protein
VRVVEEPFLTRDAILAVLRPGEVTTERPFRTLRSHDSASAGLTVPLRSAAGQVLGRVQVYSALNADAARAYRLDDRALAQALAARAGDVERSPAARRVHEAMARVAARMPLDAAGSDAPIALRRYVDLQRSSSWRALDSAAMSREWLSRSVAWLTNSSERADLIDAVVDLDRAASEARADVIGDHCASATTFYGVIKRMDHVAAEIETDDGKMLVPREDLDRQGLAVIDQPVALLREQMPSGGSYILPMAAIALEEPSYPASLSPWDPRMPSGPGVPGTVLSSDDVSWLDRELAREPNAVPVAPLPLR